MGPVADFNQTLTARRYLHRATLDEMRAAGALFKINSDDTRDHVFVDSCYFFDAETVGKRLLDFYTAHSPLKYEIDAYGDFLQPLGPDATEEYLSEARNAAVTSTGLQCMRRAVGHALAGTPLRAVPLIPSEFVHFGTHPEFIGFICGGLQEMAFPAHVASVVRCCCCCCAEKTTVAAMGSYVGEGVAFEGPCAVEFCRLKGSVTVGKNAILSDVRTREGCKEVSIPGDAQVITLALRAADVPGVGNATLPLLGVVFVTLVARGDELKTNPEAWKEPRFPVARTPEDSLEATLNGGGGEVRVSWEMAVSLKNLGEQLRLREELYAEIDAELKK